MPSNNSHRVAILFAQGERLIECRMSTADELPGSGATLELFERCTHARSTEHCSRPCCAVEPKALHTVVSLTSKGKGWDGLNAAVEDRDWQEGKCTRHEWCNLFDSYTLASYLRLEPPFEGMPEDVVIVEVVR